MGYLKHSKCYLSGAIDNDYTSINWRVEPMQELKTRFGVEVFDPFSDPKQNKGPSIKEAKEQRDKELVQKLVSGFVRKDLGVVDRSDFIIARFGFHDVYYTSDVKDFDIQQDYYNEDDSGSIIRIVPPKPRRIQIATTGTIHEVINADLYHKPTLLVCEEGWWNIPAWLLGFIPTQYWFSSWAELYCYLEKVDNGECQSDDRWHLTYKII